MIEIRCKLAYNDICAFGWMRAAQEDNMKRVLSILLITAFILAAACGCAASDTDTPWGWARGLDKNDLLAAVPWNNSAADTAPLSDQELNALLELLNGLRKSSFTENTALTGSTPEYGLSIATTNGAFYLNQSIAPEGGVEMQFGDAMWWIDSAELTAFIDGVCA